MMTEGVNALIESQHEVFPNLEHVILLENPVSNEAKLKLEQILEVRLGALSVYHINFEGDNIKFFINSYSRTHLHRTTR